MAIIITILIFVGSFATDGGSPLIISKTHRVDNEHCNGNGVNLEIVVLDGNETGGIIPIP